MKTALWVMAILSATLLNTPTNAQSPKTTAEKLDEYLTVAARMHRFNGTALITQKGVVLLKKGYGWKNEAAQTRNDTNSIYQLGSVTKTFTGAAILQLQEESKLSVNDKLNKYLPDYPNGDQISIKQLFAHTSGIYDFKAALYGKDSLLFTQPVTKERVLAEFKDKPLVNEPGKAVNYTNSGYFLLGLIIEKVEHKPFETVIRERFLTPLRLTRTGFDFINLQRPDKTTGYTYQKDSVLVAVLPLDSTAAYAAGGMYSSVNDLYSWAQAIQASKLLKPASRKLAFTPIEPGNWSYGWGINFFNKGKKLAYQNGNLPGFGTWFVLFLDDDTVVIMLSNIDDTSDATTLEPLVKDVFFILYNQPYQLPISFKTVPVCETVLTQYVGEYEFDKKHHVFITLENGHLYIEAPAGGLPKSPLFAESETTFFLKVVTVKIEFVKDPNGKITRLIAHANGKNDVCQKLK